MGFARDMGNTGATVGAGALAGGGVAAGVYHALKAQNPTLAAAAAAGAGLIAAVAGGAVGNQLSGESPRDGSTDIARYGNPLAIIPNTLSTQMGASIGAGIAGVAAAIATRTPWNITQSSNTQKAAVAVAAAVGAAVGGWIGNNIMKPGDCIEELREKAVAQEKIAAPTVG